MSNILSIIGIVVSTIGVIISLLFFNASLDNSRKVLINKVLYFITFDHEIMDLFASATANKKYETISSLSKSRIEKFNNSMFKLEAMMKDVSYHNNLGTPIIGESDELLEDKKYKHTYLISETYKVMNTYFSKRNLPNFYLLLNEYDDRCYFLQHYKRLYKYKRKFFIGPIIGLKFIDKRSHKTANYGGVKTPLLRTIKTEKDFEKYYNECYLKMNIFHNDEPSELNRTIKNLEIITDEEHRIPLTIYR